MGFLDQYEEDVFISYASQDDALIGNAAEGWISKLHSDLQKRVHQTLGQAAKFWRDDSDLKGNDQLTPTLIAVLQKTGAMISVVSPCFISSKWCRKEVEVFCAKDGGKFNAGGVAKLRIFKVMKFKGERVEEFPELKDASSYEFYEIDTEG